MEGDSSSPGLQPHHLKTSSNPNLDLGSVVYVLGYTGSKELDIGEGKVVIATDNLIKLSTDGVDWSPGSVGFDSNGNLAFLICDPMKLATSPYTKSSNYPFSSSSSLKRDRETLFGIPMPIIFGWLNQHWEGCLDEQSKPKPSLMRLMSADKRSENHAASSFITNEVFEASEEARDFTDSSSPKVITESCVEPHKEEDKLVSNDPCASTPEINKSPEVTTIPTEKKEALEIPLSNIDLDPRGPESSIPQQLSMDKIPGSEEQEYDRGEENGEVSSSGSANGVQNEVEFAGSEERDGKHETETESSAETAESRSNTTPREEIVRKWVRGGQNGVNYSRLAVDKYPVARKSSVEKNSSLAQPGKSFSPGATSHRSNDYCSPSVSSVIKKLNAISEKPKPANKTRQTAVKSAPRWVI